MPIDYLAIGHICKDITPEGAALGGTVAYAGRTAHAMGMRVGVLTSAATDIDLTPLRDLIITTLPAAASTCFENRYSAGHRVQTLSAIAKKLEPTNIPDDWRNPPIVHLGPIAGEIDPRLVEHFPRSFIGLTPQGWLRSWDEDGRVSHEKWTRFVDILPATNAVVLSLEDIDYDEVAGREMAGYCKILALTDGPNGAYLFWNGQEQHFQTPAVEEVDSTGAGDIFAAAFFVCLFQTKNLVEAATIANRLAAISVTRRGVESSPSQREVEAVQAQVKS
jgi:sugar/nucleoside kinase (ribokinase family)